MIQNKIRKLVQEFLEFLRRSKKAFLVVFILLIVAGLVFSSSFLISNRAHKNMLAIRPIAELLYDKNNGSYETLCADTKITKLVKSTHCYSEPKHWMVWKSAGFAGYWCADYRGSIQKETSIPPEGSFTCQ